MSLQGVAQTRLNPPFNLPRRGCRLSCFFGTTRAMAAASPQTLVPPEPASPIVQLQRSNHVYAALRESQRTIMQTLQEQLHLQPATSGTAAVEGSACIQVCSAGGDAAAFVQALSGPGVRWLTASGMGNPDKHVGGVHVTGRCDETSDAPHFMLEQTLWFGEVLLAVGLWPRRDWVVDYDYTRHYIGSSPPGSQRSYNDIYNAAMKRPGWKLYQSPDLNMKTVLSTVMAFTFKPEEEELRTMHEISHDLAMLWANHVKQQQQQGSGQGGSYRRAVDDDVHRYDRRYINATIEDPGNAIAARIFGQEDTNRLVSMMHGCPEAGSHTF